MNEVIEIKQAEIVQAINKAEIDIQIATAKSYPRNLTEVRNKIATYAAADRETAEDCFYVLRRGGSVIEGVSVRMAEIIALAWGNLRVQTRLVANDGKTITAQAICHDLETNVAVSKEVQRRITDKQGRTFSEDMQVVTGNAAAAIAFRNAVLTVIPKAVTKKVIDEVKDVALGQSIDLEQSRQNIMAYFAKLNVTPEQVLHYLGIKSLEEIDKEKVFVLRGVANAIKEGDTTAKESFIDPYEEAKKAADATKKASKAEKKAADAIAQAIQGKQSTEKIDADTGEVLMPQSDFDGYDGNDKPQQLVIE